MSDDLMIQGGYQPQKTNPLPYALGGAVAGAGAGWGASALYNNRNKGEGKTYEELVKDANDKDKVELTSKKAALEKAEKDLEAASKPQIADNATEKVNYDNAVKERDEAFNKLVEEKKAKLEGTKSGIDSKKFKPFDQIRTKDLPTEDLKGKPFKGNQCEKAYNDLTKAVKDAETAVNNRLAAATAAGGKRTKAETEIKNYLDAQYTAYGSKTEEEIADIFGKRTTLSGVPGFRREVPTTQYQAALTEAFKEYPEFTAASLKPEHYLEFGEEVDSKSPIQKGYQRKGVRLTDPKTNRPSTKTTYVEYKIADLDNFVAEQEKIVNEKRIAFADQLFTNAHESVLLKQQKANLEKEFAANVEKGLATQTGYYNATTNDLDINKIITESKNNRLTVGSGTKAKKGYAADIKELNRVINGAAAGTTPAMPATLNGCYSTTDPKKALEMANARKSVAEAYAKEEKALDKKIAKCITENSVIEAYDEKIAEAKANDKALQKAKAKLAEQFPALFGENASGLSADEIEKQAKEYAEKNIKKSYQDNIDKAKTELDKVIGEKGKVNETAKKAAEEAKTKAKAELENLVAELGGKAKGMNKWVKTAVIGGTAIIGGLVGSGIVNSKNKKAEEAAQNIYA